MKLNKRQELISNFLEAKGPSSRSEIVNGLFDDKSVSRITVIRDLNDLKKRGIVDIRGKGKATKYSIRQTNPILIEYDMEKYFRLDVTERKAKESFDPGVYEHLSGLFSKKEKQVWDESAIEIKKRTTELDPSIYKRELERFVIELSWKSSQIEGNTYSLIETETLIKQHIEARGHTKGEAIMILNHKSAFDSILKNRKSFQNLDYSDIAQLHGVLTKGLVSLGIRSQPVRISGTAYVPLSDKASLEDNLRRIVKLVSSTKYAPEKALIVSVMIAYLQPFADGNKRTSRMLANAILLAHGYYPLSYRNIDTSEYRKAMILFYEQNNLYHHKRLFMEQLQFAMDNYFRI